MSVPQSVFVYSLQDNSRVRLSLEDRFLHIDHAQQANQGNNFSCLTPASCVSPSSFAGGRLQSVVYFNILWADLQQPNATPDRATLTIDYCDVVAEKTATLRQVMFAVDSAHQSGVQEFAASLLNKAYKNTVRNKRLLVLINPFGGQGTARSRFTKYALPILDAARCQVDQVETKYKGHAADLIQSMQGLVGKYDAIVCCSGDGIPHEVFNGLVNRQDIAESLKIPVCQLPCGSGNALCMNLVGSNDLQFASLNTVKGVPVAIDLCSLTQDGKRYVSFLSQALGMIADCDLGTENMRWLGESRFTVGLLMRVLANARYPAEISVRIAHESKTAVRKVYDEHKSAAQDDRAGLATTATLVHGTVEDPVPNDWKKIDSSTLAIFYVGKMAWMSSDALFFPAALHRDGFMDMVIVDSKVPTLEKIKILLGVEKGKHFQSKHVQYYKVNAYRIVPKAQSGFISIDGEKFNFSPFQVEIHNGLGTVLARSQHLQAPPL
ncbi:ATP-NAD kinase-like domain-containing protein, partial [Lipomyces japonicus]|uniref:ATP-NAD kinase-like domain-containing protein n=1 Tax=Lipomyces japonicus TaxID=56871 RepID=UPI0034CF71FE